MPSSSPAKPPETDICVPSFSTTLTGASGVMETSIASWLPSAAWTDIPFWSCDISSAACSAARAVASSIR